MNPTQEAIFDLIVQSDEFDSLTSTECTAMALELAKQLIDYALDETHF